MEVLLLEGEKLNDPLRHITLTFQRHWLRRIGNELLSA